MYSPAENPEIDAFLDDQLGKQPSHDLAWGEVERRFGVERPTLGVLGDAATSGFAAEEGKPRVDWDAVADEEGGLEFDPQTPTRVTAREQDAVAHARNNRLTGVMHAERKPVQRAINANRPKMSWEQ